MKERDLVTPGAEPRGFINEFDAFALQLRKGFGKIRNPIGDVVEALAPFLQESTDRGIGSQGLHELDGADEKDTDALVRKLLHGGTRVVGYELEQGGRLLQGSDGYGDVVQWVRKHDIIGAWVRAVRAPEDA